MTSRELKTRMKQKGLTQSELARRFKRSIPAIHYFINGEVQSAYLERRFARALGVSVNELRGDNGKAA